MKGTSDSSREECNCAINMKLKTPNVQKDTYRQKIDMHSQVIEIQELAS